ncbi:MAG: hypothetical protein HGA39_06780 [Coriobacteriia bacterium]|nr:hypothetical protein [Coriobacteriia bacterium]
MLPPMLLYVRVGTPERPNLGIWLPLFLVWLVLLPIVVLALLLAMAADVVLFAVGRPYHRYTLLLLGCFEVVGAMRGTVVRIHSNENVVDIDLV